MKKYLFRPNKNKIKTRKMITILIWMTGTVVSVMSISLQKETMDEITRDYNGDIFTIISSDCQKTSCDREGRFAAPIAGSNCKCQCAPEHQIFREDINQCVKDLIDCPLAAFIRPYLTERIPVVSLPVSSGQLIHPGAHLTISGLTNLFNSSAQLLCQIDSSEMMTSDGWQEISAHSQMFELYEDGNNTFLQWVGSESVRKLLHQKLVLVRLSCSGSGTGLYKPCIGIRIGWVPGVAISGTVSESSSVITYGNKVVAQQSNNYLIIGLCLGLLGLMYVFALMIYIRTKKSQLLKYRNTQNNNSSPSNQTQLDLINRMESGNSVDNTLSSNVTTSFSTNCQSYAFNNQNVLNDQNKTRSECQLNTESKQSTNKENGEFATDNQNVVENDRCVWTEQSQNQNQSNQKIAVPERISKRCLQINPEYFEPELLLEPPPPALEFLQRIRELITNAKGRIKNFRFKPTLLVIPEDDYFYQDICKSSDAKSSTAHKNDGFCDEMPIPPPRHGRGKRAPTPIAGRKDAIVINTDSTTFTSHMSQINESVCESDATDERGDNKKQDSLNHVISESSDKVNDNSDGIGVDNNHLDQVSSDLSRRNLNDDNKIDSLAKDAKLDCFAEDTILDESFCTQSKISRKDMLTKLKDMKQCDNSISIYNNSDDIKNNLNSETINEITICDEANVSSDNSIWKTHNTRSVPFNGFVDIDEEDNPLDSLKLLSAKVAKKLSEGSVPELNYKRNETEHNEHKMFQYWMKDFRNSFGKLGSRPKPQISVFNNNDNWTLQKNSGNRKGFETDSSSYTTNGETSGDETSADKKNNFRISSKLLTSFDTNNIPSNSCQCQHPNNDSGDNFDKPIDLEFDQNLSLISNENNELVSFQSMNGYECDVGTSTDTCSISSGEVSTTSSFKGNQLTSLESISIDSDLTDDSLNVPDNYKDKNRKIFKKKPVCNESESITDLSDFQSDDDNPIEVCLKELANTPIDGSHDKYYLRIDRATKGMSALHKIKQTDWKHVCVQNHSQKGQNANGYQSDDTVSSTTTSNDSMTFRATDDMTCSNARLDMSHTPIDSIERPLSSPSIACQRRSCRMLGYSSQDTSSSRSTKTDDKLNCDLCSKYSKPKPKGSKSIKCHNQTNSPNNNFNKLLTRHPKCAPKFAVYRGPSSDDEFCRITRTPLNGESYKLNGNGSIPVDDMSSDDSNSFVVRNPRHKRLTNGTCKQYIQQRLKIKDESKHRNTFNTNHQQRTTSKETENQNQVNYICSNHRRIGSKGTVIEVNDDLNAHFVTRIPV